MLINCVAYQDGRKLADIEKHEISDGSDAHAPLTPTLSLKWRGS